MAKTTANGEGLVHVDNRTYRLVIPPITVGVDYQGELAVVIGRRGRKSKSWVC